MPKYRSEAIDNAPLRYAPNNELGVVFLFSHLAKKWRIRVDTIRPNFPDCIAYQKLEGREKRILIEFEYKSKNFLQHGHDPKKCDWIVCWEHNWPDVPKRLQVVELRREFGLGFNTWISPYRPIYTDAIRNSDRSLVWSVPRTANIGDLLLFYVSSPNKRIERIGIIKERPTKRKARFKNGYAYYARISMKAKLSAPIHLADMQHHHVLVTSGFVRGQIQKSYQINSYWPYLYDMILERNPSLRKFMRQYDPAILNF